MNEKIKKKLKEYEDVFNDHFPTFMFLHLNPSEMIAVIDKCLNENQTVYELGILKDEGEPINY